MCNIYIGVANYNLQNLQPGKWVVKEKMGGECYIIPRLILALAGTVMMMIMTQIGPMTASIDYADALSKSILFFEGQRSGKLPSTQRITWRKDSGLQDGSDIGVSLSLLI